MQNTAALSPFAEQSLRSESSYLAAVEANFVRESVELLPKAHWKTNRLDASTAVRAELASRRMFDRSLPEQMPQGRRIVWTGTRRTWWFGRRRAGVVIATTLSPPQNYLQTQQPPPPVGLNDLLEHINRIAPKRDVPHLIGICSPSGFSSEVQSSRIEIANVTLVLVEPRSDGLWKTTGVGPKADERICRLFDPATSEQRLQRIRDAVEAERAQLVTGSLSAEAMAEKLQLPRDLVAQAFRQIADRDGELRISDNGADVLLYRGAAASGTEDSDMSVGDWIRQLFGLAGNEAKKINLATQRRAELTQRRDRLYEDIAKLEHREKDLLDQGRQNTSPVVRRRVASQLAQHRRDMNRLNTMASMLNQQINVLSTHIHNLELIQQGQMAKLPTGEDLAEDAVRAEEMLEQLKSDMDLVGTLDTGINETLVTQDELDILKEFEQADTKAVTKPEATPPVQTQEPPAVEPKQKDRGAAEAG